MKVKLITEHPVALHSPDHIDAKNGGSGNDNSWNPNFNRKLKEFYGRPIRLLDLGCAGGGFVKTIIDEGHLAVGLEGSDYSLLRKRAEWATIPDSLFTCDITKPFGLVSLNINGHRAAEGCCDDKSESTSMWELHATIEPEILKFDMITAWEVMEHISENELPQLIQNVLSHLKPDGLWVMSVSTQVDHHFHRTTKGREWWTEMFASYGLHHQADVWDKFHPDWVRGPMKTPWAITADDSFHLCLKRV